MKTRLSRSEWSKTPYARSEAKNPDAAIQSLLAKYGIADIQWTQGRGPEGRRAVMLRFVMKEKPYRIMVESLDAEASEDERLIQVKRVIYFYLKSTLEVANNFITPEEALFAFLELPGWADGVRGGASAHGQAHGAGLFAADASTGEGMTPASLTLAAISAISALVAALAAAVLIVRGRGAEREALRAKVARLEGRVAELQEKVEDLRGVMRVAEALAAAKVRYRYRVRDDLRAERASRAKGKVT
jgi:membrane protein implicated in regulation of membrane protease activity